MAYTWWHHGTYRHRSWHTPDGIMAHTDTGHGIHLMASWHIQTQVMAYTWWHHGTYRHRSRHTACGIMAYTCGSWFRISEICSSLCDRTTALISHWVNKVYCYRYVHRLWHTPDGIMAHADTVDGIQLAEPRHIQTQVMVYTWWHHGIYRYRSRHTRDGIMAYTDTGHAYTWWNHGIYRHRSWHTPDGMAYTDTSHGIHLMASWHIHRSWHTPDGVMTYRDTNRGIFQSSVRQQYPRYVPAYNSFKPDTLG